MEKCNYGNCQNEATVSGYTYGHSNKGDKDSFFPVEACDEHSKLVSFFENKSE